MQVPLSDQVSWSTHTTKADVASVVYEIRQNGEDESEVNQFKKTLDILKYLSIL